ncbi:MAG: hypothetical protein ACKVOJ_09065 [Sphingomonadaceae bacterium]
MELFTLLVIGHVIAGTTALVSFWMPVFARKGSTTHIRWGRIFVIAIYSAAALACLMGILNLTLTSDRLPTVTDRALFAGLFGWMMIYLSLLSILFVRYGVGVIKNKRNHHANRSIINLIVMGIVAAAALRCGVAGVMLGQPLMVALAGLGSIAIFTFLRASLRPAAAPTAYQAEHLKAMLGAGISAYTAFLSVGLLRIMPEHVFNPIIWSVPSIVGVMLIIHNLRVISAKRALRPH